MGYVIWLLLIVSIISHGECRSRMSKEFGGPYTIKFTSMEDCKDPGNGDIIIPSNKIRSIGNNTYMLNDTVILKRPFTKDFMLTLDVSTFSNNGGWKPHAYTVEKPACILSREMLKEVEGLWEVFGECPVPAGTYTLTNMRFLNTFPLKELPYGKYKVEYFISDGPTRLFCKVVGVDCIPKNEGVKNT